MNEQLETARAGSGEASTPRQSAFGDGTLCLERFIDNPRHVEVAAAFGDKRQPVWTGR